MTGKISHLGFKIVFDRLLADPQSDLELAVYKITWTNDLGQVCQSGDWIGTLADATSFCKRKRGALYQKYYSYVHGVRGEFPDV